MIDFGFRLHWRTWIVCFLSALGGSFSITISLASALPILSHHGRWLTDPQGRVVILHGVQIDKFMPSQRVEGWIDLSPANVRFIAAEGFNAARVSMAYAGVEPQLGHYENSYVRRYLTFDRRLARSGVYDLIDMMQGEYSTLVGGGGFPDWMALTDGEPNNRDPFAGGYLDNPAEEAVWNNFWANAPVADGVGLQTHYAQGLHRLAKMFAHAPGLLGLEILNEPWPGSRWGSCFGHAGCPPGGFDQTSLTSFYRRMIHAIRTGDRRHLIAYEPDLLFDFAFPTRLGTLPDKNLLFAFHNYCLASAPGLPPNPALSAGCAKSENDTFNNAETRAGERGGALLMDEWGNTTDLTQAERMEHEADQHMVGWTVWAYEDCCGSTAAVIKDGTKPPTAPGNLNIVELNALVRPYPKLVAGTPLAWDYRAASHVFALTYSVRPVAGGKFAAGAESEVELPALIYQTGYTVKAAGAHVLSAPDANVLRLANETEATTVRLTVTPAPHHPSAPGPFTWPGPATMIASADCPAATRTAISIRYRQRTAPIVRVAIYIDSRRATVTHGRQLHRIALPAGLADGSVIRLVATTADGASRFTTIRDLRGCSLTPRAWTIPARESRTHVARPRSAPRG